MHTSDELSLLIKSKYPVVLFETIDEAHAIKQLKAIAERLELIYYQWSLTDGLRKEALENTYYETREPVAMLRMLQALLEPQKGETPPDPGLFVLKDFDKCLEDALTLRLFKDIINLIKGTPYTIVILSSAYNLPKDIAPETARLVGGYPAEEEISAVINETIFEHRKINVLTETSLNEEEFKKMSLSLKGLSLQQIRNVINECLLNDSVLNLNDLSTIEKYKKKIFDHQGILEFYLTEDRENIAGFDNLKCWLFERKNGFSSSRDSSLPQPKGVLLMGVQGCGKSLAVKVIAREFGLPLYRLDLGRLYSKYIGETEQNLRAALATAEKLSPVCLWIDEIEKCFSGSTEDNDGGVSQRVLGTFLTWMQERSTGCFIAATANNINRLPPEFLRKGRFDETFFVDLPDMASRKQLFTIHLTKRGLKPESFDLKLLAAETDGFSGAEIEQLIIAALYRVSAKKESISTDAIIDQARSTKPLSVLKREEITALRAWAAERTIPV